MNVCVRERLRKRKSAGLPLRLLLPAVFLLLSGIEARAQTPATQTIRGQVVDRDTHHPLPGANVIVLESDPLIGSTTDSDGWFVLDDVPLGRRDIQVSYLGYAPAVVPQVLVTSGREVTLHVALAEQIVEGEEIVVQPDARRGEALNELAFVSARSFTVEETRRYAGGFDDPARMASAFAGVTTGGGIQDNAMIIRGNAPRGVLWRLEGVAIPNPNHFADLSVAGGGGLTLFSSQLLADSDFVTGAFPAEYGNALAGVFDMKFRTGSRSRREYALQAGLLGLEAAAEGPFIQKEPYTYLFNYRYSTLGLLLPLLPTEDVATYQDVSFKMSFPTKAGRFELWGIGGLDRQRLSATGDSTEWEYETWDRLDTDLNLAIGAAGFSHTLVIGGTSYLRSTAAVTANRTRLDQQRIDDDLVFRDDLFIDNTDARLIFGSSLNHKFDARHTNRTGVTMQRIMYDLDLSAAHESGSPLNPVARGSGGTFLLQAYSQSNVALSSLASLTVGGHLQHFTLTGATSLEPRVGLRWQIRTDQFISLGYGLHSQIEELRIYFATPRVGAVPDLPNHDLGFARAHHAVLGYERPLGDGRRLKVEIYYQHLFDVPVIADSSYSMLNFKQDFAFSEPLVNGGAGKNYGIEVTLERFLQGGFYWLVTGSVFRSRYRGGDEIWRSTRFDRGYATNVLFGREITVRGDNLLGLNARMIVMGGRRRSPVDVPASLAHEEVVYDEHRAFSESEPGLFLIDATLTYRRNHARHSEVWALQIKNLLAAKEVQLDYNFDTDRVEEVKEGFPLPVLSYKIEF